MAIQAGAKVKTSDMSIAGAKSTGTVLSIIPAVTRRFGGVLRTFDEALVQFDGRQQPILHIVSGLTQ